MKVGNPVKLIALYPLRIKLMHDRSPIQARSFFISLEASFRSRSKTENCATQVVAQKFNSMTLCIVSSRIRTRVGISAMRAIRLKILYTSKSSSTESKIQSMRGGYRCTEYKPRNISAQVTRFVQCNLSADCENQYTFSHGLCLQGFPLLFVFISRITIFGSHGFGYILRY